MIVAPRRPRKKPRVTCGHCKRRRPLGTCPGWETLHCEECCRRSVGPGEWRQAATKEGE